MNFYIGIGVQKAGTTWLANYLTQHPEVCFSIQKELHFFDAKFGGKHLEYFNDFLHRQYRSLKSKIENGFFEKKQLNYHKKWLKALEYRVEMTNDDSKYLEYFKWLHQGEAIFSEISPSYCLIDKEGLKKMKAFLPNLKIFIILRNPIDRHWSQVRFMAPRNGFDPITYYYETFEISSYIRRNNYKRTLTNINAVFSPDEYKVLFYEHLFDHIRAPKEIKALTDFLGIDYIKPNIEYKANVSNKLTLNEEKRQYGLKKLKNVYRYFKFNDYELPQQWIEDMQYLGLK